MALDIGANIGGSAPQIGANLGDVNSKSQGAAVQKTLDNIYQISGFESNWYQALPYGFKFTARNGSSYVMPLPISPTNINITTHYATNVITTLYGTMEEHSEQRYYDITIEGTTGVAPRYTAPFADNLDKTTEGLNSASNRLPGRDGFSTRSQLLGADGFLQQTIGAISQIANAAADTIQAIRGKTDSYVTGIVPQKSGYTAFHNLYRFFKFYKDDTAGVGTNLPARVKPLQHPLIFFNYKDNNQYNVSIQRFVLRRSADNPMLYYYSIVLRAYNLQVAGSTPNSQTNNARLNELGLDGINASTAFSRMKAASGALKSGLGAVGGLGNSLGR